MLKILEIKAIPEFHLYLIYSDGVEGVINLSGLKGKGVFKIWNNPAEFEKVYFSKESNAPTWNEDLDIDPFKPYLDIKGISFDKFLEEENKNKNFA